MLKRIRFIGLAWCSVCCVVSAMIFIRLGEWAVSVLFIIPVLMSGLPHLWLWLSKSVDEALSSDPD